MCQLVRNLIFIWNIFYNCLRRWRQCSKYILFNFKQFRKLVDFCWGDKYCIYILNFFIFFEYQVCILKLVTGAKKSHWKFKWWAFRYLFDHLDVARKWCIHLYMEPIEPSILSIKLGFDKEYCNLQTTKIWDRLRLKQ